jgi:hypothetical protein
MDLFRERRRVPVFDEKKLTSILERLGLLSEMLDGELMCAFCQRKVTIQNFGAFFVTDSKEVRVSCSNSQCLRSVAEAVAE